MFFRLSSLYFLEPEASLNITLQRQKGETKKTSNPTSTKKNKFRSPIKTPAKPQKHVLIRRENT